MAASKKLKIFKLRLTTETPVSIGGDQGRALSPYADYVFNDEGDSLLYLNQTAISDSLKLENGQVDNELMDLYVAKVSAGMDNGRSNFSLKDFLRKDLKLALPAITRQTVPVFGLHPDDLKKSDKKKEVATIAKAAGKPYLPGSSIKGAIRTAILYNWLVWTKRGSETVGKLIVDLETADEIRSKHPSFRNMPFQVRKDLQFIERKFFPEGDLLGTFRSRFGPDGRRIRLTDSNTATQGLQVHHLRRIRLTPPPPPPSDRQGHWKKAVKPEIPITREAYQSPDPFEVTLTVLPGFEARELKYWESESADAILKVINTFSLACIENEIFELEKVKDEGISFSQDCLFLLNFYHDLRNRAEQGEVFMRIGFGKTIYDNSLALTMLHGPEKEDDAVYAYDAFRRNFWKTGRAIGRYPATRTVTQDGRPLGWVKLEMAEVVG